MPADAATTGGVSIRMDLRPAPGGEFSVELTGRLPRPGPARFRVAGDDAVQILNLEMHDAAGRQVAVERQAGMLRFPGMAAGDYRLRYTVRPGGAGRHGNQGNADERFVVFDGRALILPEDDRRLWPVRFRFELPDGWRAVSPYPHADGWHVAGGTPLTKSRALLAQTCQAFGAFAETRQRFGATEVGVYVPAVWSADLRRALTEKSLKLYRAFFDRYGFDPGGDQQVVWTPRAKDGKRVFGGASAVASCLEMPEENARGYELLAHRLAHALNAYEPIGMRTAPGEDRWFKEAWATHEEISAPRAAGLVADGRSWNGRYAAYASAARQYPASANWPLAREREAGKALVEFLHYRKSPLVLALLDYQIGQAGGRTLAGFVRAMYPRYRNGRGSFRFRRELEEFTGRDLGRFWNAMVRGPAPLVPVWPEFFAADNLSRPAAASAATVGGTELHPDFFLELAESGRFETFAGIAAFLREAAARQHMPEALWRGHYPAELQRHRLVVPGMVAVLLRDYENAMIPDARRYDGGRLAFAPNLADKAGAELQALLESEAAYLRQVRSGPVAALRVRALDPWTKRAVQPVLAVRDRQRYRVELRAQRRTSPVTLEWLAADGRTLHAQRLAVAEDSAEFEINDPAPGAGGVHLLRVRDASRTLAERAFWMRAPERGGAASNAAARDR